MDVCVCLAYFGRFICTKCRAARVQPDVLCRHGHGRRVISSDMGAGNIDVFVPPSIPRPIPSLPSLSWHQYALGYGVPLYVCHEYVFFLSFGFVDVWHR